MKIRNGFVSNSSSSSFVVGFNRNPADAEFLKESLFDSNKTVKHEYNNDWLDVDTLVQWVMNELVDKTPLTLDGMAEEIASGQFSGCPEFPDVDEGLYEVLHDNNSTQKEKDEVRKEIRKVWDDHEVETLAAAKKVAEKFMAENPGLDFYTLSFSDNDGSYGCHLEHGGTFDKFPHLCMSHH